MCISLIKEKIGNYWGKYWWTIIILVLGLIFYNVNLIIIGIIFIGSFILGLIKYKTIYYNYNAEKDTKFGQKNAEDPEKSGRRNAPWQWKFIEIWNCSINFLLGGLIGYYFVSVRWSLIFNGGELKTADFILLFIFMMCLTGWFPYLLKNFTEGINAIIVAIIKPLTGGKIGNRNNTN